MMKHLTALLLLSAVVSTPAYSEIDDDFYAILEESLHLNIAARITEQGEDLVWDVESSKLTIPGKAVTVKLIGSNVVVLAHFTPYEGEDGSLILLAQGQVWVSSGADEELQYLTTMKTIPVQLGERVTFFPLGMDIEQQADNLYNIELEIEIKPHN